jgi:hypothetical protein
MPLQLTAQLAAKITPPVSLPSQSGKKLVSIYNNKGHSQQKKPKMDLLGATKRLAVGQI